MITDDKDAAGTGPTFVVINKRENRSSAFEIEKGGT